MISILFFANTYAEKECSRFEAFAAESVTDYLDSWSNVYLFYKQYNHCNDGSISEGASDKIELLWFEHWDLLPEMQKIASSDPEFKEFLLKEVNSELFPKERFDAVQKNARSNCPPSVKEFCLEFIKGANQK